MTTREDLVRGGLTEDEATCMSHVLHAWEAWIALQRCRADEDQEFCRCVHGMQQLLALRVLSRQYPELWGLREPKENPVFEQQTKDTENADDGA